MTKKKLVNRNVITVKKNSLCYLGFKSSEQGVKSLFSPHQMISCVSQSNLVFSDSYDKYCLYHFITISKTHFLY